MSKDKINRKGINQMKYIVEVNAKYLVSIEADSPLEAEHKVLEYEGIWGALAFDQKSIKTDTFAGAVQGCEMISMNELITMSDDLADKRNALVHTCNKYDEALKQIKELEAALKKANEQFYDVDMAHKDALSACAEAQQKIGDKKY